MRKSGGKPTSMADQPDPMFDIALKKTPQKLAARAWVGGHRHGGLEEEPSRREIIRCGESPFPTTAVVDVQANDFGTRR